MHRGNEQIFKTSIGQTLPIVPLCELRIEVCEMCDKFVTYVNLLLDTH